MPEDTDKEIMSDSAKEIITAFISLIIGIPLAIVTIILTTITADKLKEWKDGKHER